MFCEPFAVDDGAAMGSGRAATGGAGTPGGRLGCARALAAAIDVDAPGADDPAALLVGPVCPVGPVAASGRLPPVIGFARGAPAGVGTIGRATA
jgi:hypothetical protein